MHTRDTREYVFNMVSGINRTAADDPSASSLVVQIVQHTRSLCTVLTPQNRSANSLLKPSVISRRVLMLAIDRSGFGQKVWRQSLIRGQTCACVCHC